MKERKTPEVFIDTNVWFSAFYGSGNCEKILRAHINNQIQAVISQQVLRELAANLKNKLPEALPIFEKLFRSAPPTVTKDATKKDKKLANLVDKKDQKILASTIRAECKYFVTGNLKDFKRDKIEDRYGVEILNPKETIRKLNL